MTATALDPAELGIGPKQAVALEALADHVPALRDDAILALDWACHGPADAALAEQHGTGRVEADRDRHQAQERREHDQEDHEDFSFGRSLPASGGCCFSTAACSARVSLGVESLAKAAA